MTNNWPKVAYIVSMINGLEPFIYREVKELYKKGLKLVLFATKIKNDDIYSPKPEWEWYHFNIWATIMLFPILFFQSPIRNTVLLIEALRFSELPDFMIALYYANIMKRIGIQRIHCHFGDRKLFIGYFCKRILRLPLSVTIHAHELWANPNKSMFSHVIGKVDKIVAVAELNRKILIDNYGVEPNKIEVIRLFVDTDIYRKTEKKRVLTIGRFTERKGFDVLLKAIKILNREDTEFIFIGFGPLDVYSLAKQSGVADKVTIFGKMSQRQLRVFYDLCDIYCLPSKTTEEEGKEGIPVVLMEAMSFNMPVVATRNGAVEEIVGDILVEENNPEALAEGINQLLDNIDLRVSQGNDNRGKIVKDYSITNVDRLFKFHVVQ